MMIQTNGVFKLLGGNILIEPIDCMGVCWIGTIRESKGGALDTWTESWNIGMFGFDHHR
jgi:hypothetical protein